VSVLTPITISAVAEFIVTEQAVTAEVAISQAPDDVN